jgi:hypothetical protein
MGSAAVSADAAWCAGGAVQCVAVRGGAGHGAGGRAKSARLTLLNGGLLAAGGVVVARFFDSDMDLLARGIAFVLLGAGLLGSNLYVMRRKGGRS